MKLTQTAECSLISNVMLKKLYRKNSHLHKMLNSSTFNDPRLFSETAVADIFLKFTNFEGFQWPVGAATSSNTLKMRSKTKY